MNTPTRLRELADRREIIANQEYASGTRGHQQLMEEVTLFRAHAAALEELAAVKAELAQAERRGMERAAGIIRASAKTIALHIKPYEPINEANARLLLGDCADACVDLSESILAAAQAEGRVIGENDHVCTADLIPIATEVNKP